jgi:hypothetical protein
LGDLGVALIKRLLIQPLFTFGGTKEMNIIQINKQRVPLLTPSTQFALFQNRIKFMPYSEGESKRTIKD